MRDARNDMLCYAMLCEGALLSLCRYFCSIMKPKHPLSPSPSPKSSFYKNLIALCGELGIWVS